MANSGITNADLVNYVPDYLTGSAREFFRTLNPQQTDSLAHLQQALTDHFDSDNRRQVALQKFYQADQTPRETVAEYYCRIKELGCAAFSNLSDQERAQQVLACMRQGLWPDIRHALIGTATPASPKVLKMTAEAVKMEIRNIPTDAPTTAADIRALILELRAMTIYDTCNRIPAITRLGHRPTTPTQCSTKQQ